MGQLIDLSAYKYIHEWPAGVYPGYSDPIAAEAMARSRAAHPAGKRLDLGLSRFEEDVHDQLAALGSLLVSKQADYGPHAINRAPGGALNGVLVRLHDKVERLKNLADTDRNPDHESVRDTWRDVANYAVIALMLIDGTWPE